MAKYKRAPEIAKHERYGARPRANVQADLAARNSAAPTIDCRGTHEPNPNESSRLYGISSGRYDALAVRSEKQNRARKARDEAWVERTFRYEGLGNRKSGRTVKVDPDRDTRAGLDARWGILPQK